jgi:hypothetical protein
MKKKKRLINFGLIFLISIFLVASVSASFCCERTKLGAWCQNVENEADCDASYDSVQTSCEATYYCRTGTCIDNNEGLCMPNTAERTCTDEGGAFDSRTKDEIPQCQNGCCLIGENAAFVTQVRCEKLASDAGQESDFRAEITEQMQCLASANPSERGACVFTNDKNQKDCDMITREECQARQTTTGTPITQQSQTFLQKIFGGGQQAETPTLTELGVSFNAEFLCSAEELNTICGPRGGTACGEDDKVYFQDTCNNLANVYDNRKLNDNDYWTHIRSPTCDDGAGNKGSATCGDCDFSGSICKQKKIGETVNYGNFICRNLDCVDYTNADEGFAGTNHPKYGERWCAKSSGVETITATTEKDITTLMGGDNPVTNNLPGSRYTVKQCYNGEITLISCSEFRGEVCVQSDLDETDAVFRSAVCKEHVFTQCYGQNNSKDCENRELRDCKWMGTGYGFSDKGLINKTETDETKNNINIASGICVPLYAPGFDRTSDNVNENGADICPRASSACVVTYELPVGGGAFTKKSVSDLTLEEKKKRCVKNCQCLPRSAEEIAAGETEWQTTMNSMCIALGDCGNKNNLLGKLGEVREVIMIKAADSTA